MIKGIKLGIGFFVGFFLTATFAFVVSGTVKTWTTGETLTAADLNTTVQSLKTAVENAGQYYEAGATYYSTAPTYQWSRLVSVGSLGDSEKASFMPRDGVVKNARLEISSNTVNAACIITLRKNSIDTAIQFSIPQGSTTTITEADTVSFSATNTLGWHIVCSGASSGSIGYTLAFEF